MASRRSRAADPSEPLAGVREKLDRADHHVNTLREEIDGFIDAKRDSIVGSFDRGRSSYIFRLQDLDEPPLRWRVIMGDVAHNQRSALDHLAWQVIRRHRTPKRKTGFPICDEEPEEGFARWAQGTTSCPGPLFGAGGDAFECIEKMQPYHGGECRLLLVLNQLWNADKHRFLLPRYICMSPLGVLAARYVSNADAGGTLGIRVGSGRVTERGMELAVVQLNPTGPNPKVEMKGRPPLAITFSGGQDVVGSFEEIGAYIRSGVLARLEPLFS